MSAVCRAISHIFKSQNTQLAVCRSSQCETGHYTLTSQSGDALAPSDDSICTEIVRGLAHWLVSLGCVFRLVKTRKSPSNACFHASITSSVQGGPKASTLVSKNTKKAAEKGIFWVLWGRLYPVLSKMWIFFLLYLERLN